MVLPQVPNSFEIAKVQKVLQGDIHVHLRSRRPETIHFEHCNGRLRDRLQMVTLQLQYDEEK